MMSTSRADFLDVPQYFWDQNTFQPFWKRLHDYLELENRMEVLNLRIRCLKEVLKVVCRRKVSGKFSLYVKIERNKSSGFFL